MRDCQYPRGGPARNVIVRENRENQGVNQHHRSTLTMRTPGTYIHLPKCVQLTGGA